jgi:hypothetical protein
VKVLNLSGNKFNAGTIHHVAEALVKLTALERIHFRQCRMGAEGAGRLAEPLGKLTALQHLDLRGTGSAFCFWVFGFFPLEVVIGDFVFSC